MTITDSMAHVAPVRFGPDSKFRFKCHKEVTCYTKCCRDINIVLTPYDIIRLKGRLQLASEEFLRLYTVPRLLEKTDLPMVTLRMLDDDQKSCPFVREDGCIVYEDRPTTCRYYPIGVASLSHKAEADDEEFYFFLTNLTARDLKKIRNGQCRNGARIKGLISMMRSMPGGPI